VNLLPKVASDDRRREWLDDMNIVALIVIVVFVNDLIGNFINNFAFGDMLFRHLAVLQNEINQFYTFSSD
jgi:hypothetical protein